MFWIQFWNGFAWVTLAEAFRANLAWNKGFKMMADNGLDFRIMDSISGELVER